MFLIEQELVFPTYSVNTIDSNNQEMYLILFKVYLIFLAVLPKFGDVSRPFFLETRGQCIYLYVILNIFPTPKIYIPMEVFECLWATTSLPLKYTLAKNSS